MRRGVAANNVSALWEICLLFANSRFVLRLAHRRRGISCLVDPPGNCPGSLDGVRPLMVFGLLLLASRTFLYSKVAGLGDIYGIHALLGISLACCGLVVNIIIVSRWFVRRRGIALGIVLAGTSLANAAMPQLNTWLIAELGWRSAFMYLSMLPLALIPVVILIMRERPSDLGLEPLRGTAGLQAVRMMVRPAE